MREYVVSGFSRTVIAVFFASCGMNPPLVQPGAPGEPTRDISARQAADLSQIRDTVADVRFMQGMIGHHAQALEMTALVPSRTPREDLQLLANRLEISQADEIQMMREWLTARGAQLLDPHAHHPQAGQAGQGGEGGEGRDGANLMPGMLTAGEMRALAAAKGADFERLFLEFMIKHHEGALTMVAELFSAKGAGQQSDIFTFASDVDADQRMEIERMGGMLRELQK